jgi:hypothetical protein
MIDHISALENARLAKRLTQAEMAVALEMTQGHYSKVIRRLVPLSSKLEARADAWLAEHGRPANSDDASVHRARQLLVSIRAQCMELMHLADQLTVERRTAGYARHIPPV